VDLHSKFPRRAEGTPGILGDRNNGSHVAANSIFDKLDTELRQFRFEANDNVEREYCDRSICYARVARAPKGLPV